MLQEQIFNAWEQVDARCKRLKGELEKAWEQVQPLAQNRADEAWSKVYKLQFAYKQARNERKDLETLFDNVGEYPTFIAVEV